MSDYPKEMHQVNAALLRCLIECNTWAQYVQWSDGALKVYAQAAQMRDENAMFRQQMAGGMSELTGSIGAARQP